MGSDRIKVNYNLTLRETIDLCFILGDILEQATQWFGIVAEFEQGQNKCC